MELEGLEEFEIECEHCGWEGYFYELVSVHEKGCEEDWSYCPKCLKSVFK